VPIGTLVASWLRLRCDTVRIVRLGLISDVHGNRVALEAVVADAAHRNVDRWWVLGDLVAIGPEPVRTLEVLVELPQVAFTAGNTESYVLTGQRPAPTAEDVASDPSLKPRFDAVERSFSWTTDALSGTPWLDWLGELGMDVRQELPDRTRLLGVHVLPGRADGPGITPHRPDAELAEAFIGADADIVVAGHTHQPTDRQIGAVRAINLGSVSNPVTDDLRASYVIVHADRHGHRIEHRRVAYDQSAFLDCLDRSGHPERDYIASFQRGEQFQHRARRPGAPTPAN
jgi:predicted phosphodiesterase